MEQAGGSAEALPPAGASGQDDRGDRVAVGAVGAEGPAAVFGLGEVVDACEVFDLVWEVDAVVNPLEPCVYQG
jgi:hypothetical protein